jgi:hypothetical protein
MVDRLGTKQGLNDIHGSADIRFRRRFPVGRAAGAWQIAASQQQPSAGEKPFRTGHIVTGGIRHVANVHD